MIRLKNELENVKTVAVAGHIRPDGDCTGSCLAVYSYLQENFPEISVDVYLEAVNPNFLFLKGADQVKTSCAEDKKYDLFISLDASDKERLGDVYKRQGGKGRYQGAENPGIQNPSGACEAPV